MNSSDTTTRRRGPQRPPRWTPRTLRATSEDAGRSLRDWERLWGCAYTTVRRIFGLQDDPFRSDHSKRRGELVDFVAEHLKVDRDGLAAELNAMWAALTTPANGGAA